MNATFRKSLARDLKRLFIEGDTVEYVRCLP